MTHRSLAVALAVLAVSGCSDFATAPNRTPTSFTMTPDTVLLSAGETMTFEYTVLDQDGNAFEALPGWAAPLWTYSEEDVVRVDVDGVAEALAAGEVEATAELAGMEAEALVRVNPAELRVQVGFAYINQSAQRRVGDVQLVAGRPGLLRVYLQGDQVNFFQPTVIATFRNGGVVTHVDTLAFERAGLPGGVSEGEDEWSYDAYVPGSVLQVGTTLVLEIDPEGVVPATSNSTLRVPETGEQALDIAEVPPFQVRLVPVNQSLYGLESRFDAAVVEDRLRLTGAVFPVSVLDADVRAPYTTDLDLGTDSGWYTLIEDIATLRLDDGSPRYYYGGFQRPPGTGILGLGYVGYPVSIGTDASSGTLAHELGHNLGLPHAPCGNPAGPDPSYPHQGGGIGVWGWDRIGDRLRDPSRTYDLMSYCDPAWISDYNYEKVKVYRDTSAFDGMAGGAATAATEEVLIVHAGVLNGALRLSPALETAAAPSLPDRDEGRYALQGLDADGTVLFTLRFEPRPLDHVDGALFSAAIPARIAQPERLEALRVTGPEGVALRTRGGVPGGSPGISLDGKPGPGGGATARWDAASYPLVVVRDPATGEIVAMGRTGRLELLGDVSGMDVSLSDGVRTHAVEIER